MESSLIASFTSAVFGRSPLPFVITTDVLVHLFALADRIMVLTILAAWEQNLHVC
jgi:hypothetical protein